MFGWRKSTPAESLPYRLADHPVVALRCALRSFSALAGLADNPVHPQGGESETLYIAAMRGLVVSWSCHLYSFSSSATERAAQHLLEAVAAFDPKLATHYEHWSGFHDALIASMFDNLDHARRVCGFVGVALGAPVSVTTAASIFPKDEFATSPFPIGDCRWRSWSEQNRAAAEADVTALRAGTDPTVLVQERLWRERSHEALAVTMASLRWSRMTTYHWLPQHVDAWVRERTAGALVLSRSAEESKERFRRIIELPDEFWRGRVAEDVMLGLDHAINGSMDNPHWGEVTPSSQRLYREQSEARRRADEVELASYRRNASPN